VDAEGSLDALKLLQFFSDIFESLLDGLQALNRTDGKRAAGRAFIRANKRA
jgi:hypothetical protein